jgi:steroid delta-isomerase-like uncharacterized protein
MGDMMAVEANKAIVRRYKVGILNSRDVDALDEIVAVDYLDHAAFPTQAPGLEGLKQRVATLIKALDPFWTIHDMIAERDIVVIRWSHVGTHRGEFLGIPPTGRQFTFKGIDIYRLHDGMMAEHWNAVDMYGFLQQIRAIPAPETASLPDRTRDGMGGGAIQRAVRGSQPGCGPWGPAPRLRKGPGSGQAK